MSKPPPAVAAIRRACRESLRDVPVGSTVMVACSGGADSLALLTAAVFASRARGHAGRWRVVGATVDHQLQPDSGAVADRVLDQMREIGADETVRIKITVDAGGEGPEAAARQGRYAALDAFADQTGAAVILLGHTRDDQAETVLLGLARGSGGRSIAGMRRGFGRYRRPLLDVSRAQTEDACRVLGLDYWQDPHNVDSAYTRVRVRTVVLPTLEAELGPGMSASLARTADLLRADMEFLDELAEGALRPIPPIEGHVVDILDVMELQVLPGPIRTRVLRLAALRAGAIAAELGYEHIHELDRLVTDWRGQGGIPLPGAITAKRVGEQIRLDAIPGS